MVLSEPRLAFADFIPLGDLEGGIFRSEARGVSGDGSTVVGFGHSGPPLSDFQAFRWTRTEGMVGLGFLPGTLVHQSSAQSTSSDGSVVVGFEGSVGREAFRWTRAEGMVSLGFLPGHDSSEAYGVSANGLGIVGTTTSPSPALIFQAFRWTREEGMLGLGWLPGAPRNSSVASAVSPDGSVIVGVSNSAAVPFGEAFRWTPEGGMIGLGILPGHNHSGGSDVSAEGAVVVGGSGTFGPEPSEAFRWTAAEGMVGLGFLPGHNLSEALGVSADGSVIVGYDAPSRDSPLAEAFIWDSVGGMRKLQDVLASQGDDLTGWQLRLATDISADGTTIVGWGINPAGQTEAWLARTAVVPEPSSLVPFGLCSLALLIHVWRQRKRARLLIDAA